jgi:hypothetical protein
MEVKFLIDPGDGIDDLQVFLVAAVGEIEAENVYALLGKGEELLVF